MTSTARIAGAPISWGVCEVPGWGHQLAASRVLAEMYEIGLTATEFGPPGFLSLDQDARSEQLAQFGLRGIGGFLPLLLHRRDVDVTGALNRYLDDCAACDGSVLVLAAATGVDGYGSRPALSDEEWRILLGHLDRAVDMAGEYGIRATLHPHIGTAVQDGIDVDRVLEGSQIALCLDTGHLAAAGVDPAALARSSPERIGHVHLKDVRSDLAAQVVEGRLDFVEAVREGMWTRLGEGSLDIPAIVGTLSNVDYQGWYVLEQDLMLSEEPGQNGPKRDVAESLAYVLGLLG